MACSRCTSPASSCLHPGWYALALLLALGVACASGELPARTAADPANPSAPEGAPAPEAAATTAGSGAASAPDPHAHHGHTMPAPPSASASSSVGHQHQGH